MSFLEQLTFFDFVFSKRKRKKTETCTEQLRFTSLMFPYFAYLFIVCLCFNIVCTVSGCRNWIYQLLTVFYSIFFKQMRQIKEHVLLSSHQTPLQQHPTAAYSCQFPHVQHAAYRTHPITCTFIYSLLF